MTSVSAIESILEADGTLTGLATGGIYTLNDESARLGINRTLTSGAFDSDGIIRPCILIKNAGGFPDGALQDDVTQYVTLREPVEIWFYQDAGFGAIDSMRVRVKTLLHAQQLPGTFMCYWDGDSPQSRDIELGASVMRSRYMIRRAESG